MERSIEIRATPEKVWEMLALDRLPEWLDEMEMKSGKYTSEVHTPEDKYKVGAIAHIIEKRWEYDLEITESLENKKMMVHSIGKYTYTFTFTLKPVDGGTKLTLVGDLEIPWRVLGTIYKALTMRSFRKQLGKFIENLRAVLEK